MASRRVPPERGAAPPGSESLLARAAPWAALAVLLAATALAYAPSLSGPFVLDDWGSIQANMALRRPEALHLPSLPELLGPARRVTEVTFAADWRAAGLDPVRFHAVGLLLHLAAVVAAFAFLDALLRRAGHPRARAVALVVAGLFALHPIQAESVAYAAQRSEVLAALLVLVALRLLDGAAAAWGRPRGTVAWGGGTLAWIIGMGAKSTAIAAPGAWLVDQAVVAPSAERGGAALRKRVLRAVGLSVPMVLLAGWAVVLHLRAFASTPSGGAGFEATSLGPGAYFLTQLRVSWLYLRLLAWPSGLAFDRTFPPSAGLDPAAMAAGVGILAVVALAAWLWAAAERAGEARPASRLAAFGILFWLVALAPTSSFVPVADLAVEHRVYLAAMGPFLAVVVGVDAALARLLSPRRARGAAAAIACAVLLALGISLHARATTWSSEESLWRESAVASPDNARAWTNLGLAQARRGDVAGAEASYERGWRVVRSTPRAVSLARNHAALLVRLGRPADAVAVVDRALARSPDEPSLRANRAAALAALGRPSEALVEARRAAELSPGDPLMQNVLGQALFVNGDPEGALAAFQAAAALDPGVPGYPVSAALSLAAMGRREEACAAFAGVASRFGPRALPPQAAALGCPTQTSR